MSKRDRPEAKAGGTLDPSPGKGYPARIMPIDASPAFAALVVVALAAIILALAWIYRIGRERGRFEAERGLQDLVSGEREDAARRSRAVLAGQAAEQLAPWLPGFPWNPSELRFLGKPIDFIVFRGASAGAIEEIVFVEVKTGASSLSRVERSLRDAVREGRVSWAEYRPPPLAPGDPAER